LAALSSSESQDDTEAVAEVAVDLSERIIEGLFPVFSQYVLKIDLGLEVVVPSLQTLLCSALFSSLPYEEREERELYEDTDCSSEEYLQCSDSDLSLSLSIESIRLEYGSESNSGTEALVFAAWCELLGKVVIKFKLPNEGNQSALLFLVARDGNNNEEAS
jgi:hypothetical protein